MKRVSRVKVDNETRTVARNVNIVTDYETVTAPSLPPIVALSRWPAANDTRATPRVEIAPLLSPLPLFALDRD